MANGIETLKNFYNVATGTGLHEQAMRDYLNPFVRNKNVQVGKGPVGEYMSEYLKSYIDPNNPAGGIFGEKGRGPDQMQVVGLGESPNPFTVSGIARAAEMAKDPSFQAENLFGEGTLTRVPGGFDYTGGKFDFNFPGSLEQTLFAPSTYGMKFDRDMNVLDQFDRDFRAFDQARMGGTRQPSSFRSLNDPEVYGEIDQSRELEEKSLRDLFENVLDFLPLGEKSLSGILLNALQSGKDKLTGFRDAVGRRFNIRTGMQEPPGAEGRGGYGISRPGNTLTDRTRANRAQFSDFYSNFQGGAQHQMGKRVDDVISRTAQGRRTRSDAQSFVNKYGSQEQKDRFNQAKAPKAAKGSFRAAQDEGTTGSSKIVCTMMNKSYGFGSFRNKIWMKFHKDLSPEYQKGYHKIFLPLVKIAKKNKIVKKILEHIAVHSTIDMRQSMRGKKHLLGRLYRKIILPICYWAGKK